MCFRRVVTVFQKGNKCVSEGENSAFRNGSRVFRNGSRAFRPGQKTFRNGTLARFRRTTLLCFGMEVGRALSIFAKSNDVRIIQTPAMSFVDLVTRQPVKCGERVYSEMTVIAMSPELERPRRTHKGSSISKS